MHLRLTPWLLGSVLALSACAQSHVTTQDDYTEVNRVASQCAKQIQQRAPGSQLSTIYYINHKFVKAGGFITSQDAYRGVPYIEASALDSGAPGSAWQACMRANKPADIHP